MLKTFIQPSSTKLIAILTISICTLLTSTNTLGQNTVYISDVLYVPLRSGAGTQYRIINAAMKSSTVLKKLEQSEDGEWSRVVTQNGTEGWIKNQYLTSDMTAQLKLNQTLAKLAKIEKENATLSTQSNALKSKNQELSVKTREEFASRSKMAKELDKIKQISSGAIDLNRRHQELLKKYELTQTERDSLLAENENMKNDQKLSFFLYGAGVLIFGMVLAIVLPALKPKKNYSEWA